MARRITPFSEVLNIVERDSYLEEDSSGDEDLRLNLHSSIKDGTTLSLEDIASISRAFGCLIPPCERDSLLVLDEGRLKKDSTANAMHYRLRKTTNPEVVAAPYKNMPETYVPDTTSAKYKVK